MTSKFFQYMKYAINQAKKASDIGEVPIGAVIVKDNEIIASAHNQCEQNKNPMHHAEILAIEQACKKLGSKYLMDASIFITLEPCPMCAHAISLAKIGKVYFGAYDPKGGAVVNNCQIYEQNSCHHAPQVYDGIMESECSKIISEFFATLRT